MTRRFIAGAVCPRCGKIDKLFIDDGGDICECAGCGLRRARPGTDAAAPPSRIGRPAPRRAQAPAERVRILGGEEREDGADGGGIGAVPRPARER